ncbi:MAG: hypothetical protein JWN14_19 [Chthonomonadales bacterium]|nr:hypothetical protein [Chthonomonadales bacterium]
MSEQPSVEERKKWHRYFGVECNNRAWHLADSETRSTEEDTEMLHTAHAAALHWAAQGVALNNARAEMLLGHVYALLGEGGSAMRYARASFDFLAAHDSLDWEMAFAHAILAHAAVAANDTALYRAHYAKADEIGAILGEEDRAIFRKTFAVIPAPKADRGVEIGEGSRES